jgi:hypothetical protein
MAKKMNKDEAIELLPNAIHNLSIAIEGGEEVEKYKNYFITILRIICGSNKIDISKVPRKHQKNVTALMRLIS